MTTTKEDFEAMQAMVKEKAKKDADGSYAKMIENFINPEERGHTFMPNEEEYGIPGLIPKAKAIAVERDRGMNKTERKYSLYLKALLRAGEIAWFEYEPIKLRLADACLYIPDFMVVTKDGHIEIHDTKAWWAKAKKVGIEGDSMIKMKGIAEKYPMFKVLATWEKDGKWEQRVF